MLDRLCKDNVLCCDDNCKRCANLIYGKYMEQKDEINELKEKEKRLYKELEQLALMTEETDIKEKCEL